MPLHLLGKKSWNVYNKDNIARVRRDEALAKAREDERDQRLQEIDAERRIELLRDQRPSSPPSQHNSLSDARAKSLTEGRHRKRRRLAGEDDTDRDIRFAKEDALSRTDAGHGGPLRKPTSDAPLTDASGHISLFPSRAARSDKNEEVEAEAAKKRREYEDQYTMRFSNAAGYRQKVDAPWYSSSTQELGAGAQNAPSKDVWGNEDPRRREREKVRVEANDPLAAMKKGVRQLREVEKEKREWEEERKRELEALKREEKESRRRRRRSQSHDNLDEFKLDGGPDLAEKGNPEVPRHERSHSSHHRHKHRRHREERIRATRPGEAIQTEPPASWLNAPGKRYSAQFAEYD
ncbi:conserved hypothetical protein [Uncinocarpus reesii 1704]|uniref:CBF1-interacting co-repressor CIR N-terminal domain-containing protein n=1 Tax=Uncinocarpus reesii (strain UAMH 1704) TaxID=336963 RepID=C4JYJ1_UNCRE|nr:uncharacterized protein UREG_07242 [Uncinocarpus reesii 1704]EEP82377.1 conserved hypothetical protein [Uncinocarpus reesii 1704]